MISTFSLPIMMMLWSKDILHPHYDPGTIMMLASKLLHYMSAHGKSGTSAPPFRQ